MVISAIYVARIYTFISVSVPGHVSVLFSRNKTVTKALRAVGHVSELIWSQGRPKATPPVT